MLTYTDAQIIFNYLKKIKKIIFDNLHKIGNHDALEYFYGIYNIDLDKYSINKKFEI